MFLIICVFFFLFIGLQARLHRRRERKDDVDVEIASDGESRIVRVGGEALRLREVKSDHLTIKSLF